MVLLDSFWTPCFFYRDVEKAVVAIALYTGLGSVISMTYTIYVMSGGDSSNPYMPFFETDRSLSTFVWGGFALLFFWLFIVSSTLLVWGVVSEIRGWMLPWFIQMAFILLLQTYFALHWLFDYYIYLDQIFAMLCLFLWMAYNIYTMLAVHSVYKIIVEKQNPRAFEYVPESYTENTLFYWDENV